MDEYIGLSTDSIGARVVVHSPRQLAEPAKNGFNIRPGLLTSVAVKMLRFNRLEAPFETNCSMDFPLLYAEFAVPQVHYSVEECQNACIRREIWIQCKCYEFYNIVKYLPMKHLFNPEETPDYCLWNDGN